MDWSKGFTARYYATIVDPLTWRDMGRVDISGGTIKLSDSNLRESADIQCKTFDQNAEYWIRIFLEARQEDEGSTLVPLFTGLVSVPSRNFTGLKETSSLQCYSVLKPAEDYLLPLGWNIMAGYNGPKAVYDLLTSVTPAPVRIEGDPVHISMPIVAESGESALSMTDYILSVIGWRLRINGRGEIVICPEADEITSVYSAANNDVIEMNVSISNNWYDCPNVFRAINGDMIAIAKDEDPDSPFSISSRGREIWMEENGCTLRTDETLGQYSRRRLQEEQIIIYSLSYNRRVDPDVRVSDLIGIVHPDQTINGTFRVTSQSITIGYGASVSEESVSA